MKIRRILVACGSVAFLASSPAAYVFAGHHSRIDIDHVLLISIDGMHELDYLNCVKAGTCPNLAALGQTGVNYLAASTSKPSDSFPGLTAIVSGGSPRTEGVFYDCRV